ncbi:MAG: YfhO family protein, partial [Lachnospiraceae bacterium]
MKSKMENKLKKNKFYWLWAFLLTQLILVASYGLAEILPGQKWLFLDGDLLSQYALCCKLFWTKLFHGENLYYSFQTGFGMNDSLLYSFMALNPFNVFYAIIPDLNIAGIVSYS